MKQPNRTELIAVRFTKKERGAMETRAQQLGYTTLSDYIRNAMRRALEAGDALRRAV